MTSNKNALKVTAFKIGFHKTVDREAFVSGIISYCIANNCVPKLGGTILCNDNSIIFFFGSRTDEKRNEFAEYLAKTFADIINNPELNTNAKGDKWAEVIPFSDRDRSLVDDALEGLGEMEKKDKEATSALSPSVNPALN